MFVSMIQSQTENIWQPVFLKVLFLVHFFFKIQIKVRKSTFVFNTIMYADDTTLCCDLLRSFKLDLMNHEWCFPSSWSIFGQKPWHHSCLPEYSFVIRYVDINNKHVLIILMFGSVVLHFGHCEYIRVNLHIFHKT